ncbi:MAG: ImmA/IrrE family metallo-endopeptidase [Patescibacteria group bacterium]
MVNATKRNEIEAAAKELLTSVYSDNEHISLPVDLAKILENYNINLVYVKFKDKGISGAFDKEKNTIYVNTDDSFTRKSFTIAHELGHLILHKDKPREFFYRLEIAQIAEEDREEDIEANLFAASLLMPESLIKKYWELTKDIDKLATIFGASVPAVYFRLKNLHLKE